MGSRSSIRGLVEWWRRKCSSGGDRPGFGLQSPLEFVPHAEEFGLISGIDRYVLAGSIGLLDAHPNLRLNVNISAHTILEDGFTEDFLSSLDALRATMPHQSGVDRVCTALRSRPGQVRSRRVALQRCSSRTGRLRLGVRFDRTRSATATRRREARPIARGRAGNPRWRRSREISRRRAADGRPGDHCRRCRDRESS